MLLAAAGGSTAVTGPSGGWAEASVADDGSVHVVVRAGAPLDEVVLRSYCTGAAHMAIGFVTSESLAVDELGDVHDLTVRSFGILRAVDTPPIVIAVEPSDAPPVNASDAVFASVAAAVWLHQGRPGALPSGRMLR